jgi:hypothetical protein
MEHEIDEGAIFTDIGKSVDFFKRYRSGPFHLVFRPESLEMAMAWPELIFAAQTENSELPVGLFLDESSRYSTSHKWPRVLDDVYTKSRRRRINLVTVVQWQSQVHPQIRASAHCWVVMRNKKVTQEIKEVLTNEEIEAVKGLTPLTPGVKAESGVHYICDLPDIDPVQMWRDHLAL